MMLDLGLSLTGPGAFPIGGAEPPEEDGLILTDADGNTLADAQNNQLTISQFTGPED